jgi:hypothetical protein
MRRIEHLSTRIREHTYPWNSDMRDRYFQSRRDDWNLLCVAMDTLDDTSLALEDYEAAGLGTESGGKYLRLYGMLQAVFLQQDCIRNLHKLFGDTDWTPSIDSRWQEIRELRNLTIGHPVEMIRKGKGTMRCFISRITIRDDEFRLCVWNKEDQKDDFVTVNLGDVYEGYKEEALEVLRVIYHSELTAYPVIQDE